MRLPVVHLVGDTINSVISEPHLAVQLSESVFVILPIAIEVYAAIFPPLNDRPSELTVLELAIDEEGGATAGTNGINAVAG